MCLPCARHGYIVCVFGVTDKDQKLGQVISIYHLKFSLQHGRFQTGLAQNLGGIFSCLIFNVWNPSPAVFFPLP